jgi:sugar phosphate isomerase/epimerase
MQITHSRIAVCSWSLQPKAPAELIQRVKAAGLSSVQLALSALLNDPGWKGTHADLSDAGIRIISGMMGCVGEDYSTIESIRQTGGVMPDDTWPATLANMRAAAPLAKQLGLKLVTFHAGFIPHEPNSREFAKGISRVAEVAQAFADEGVTVALETGQEPATALVAFLKHLNRSDVGVNFDPANMLLYGSGDPISALALLMPYVKQVHIKDAISSGIAGQWGREVPAGTGQVDWGAFFRVLSDHQYAGDFVIEREAGGSRIEDVKAAVALVNRVAGDARSTAQ